MKADAKTELEKILAAYDQKLADTARAEAEAKAAHAAFPAKFETAKAEVIRPALQEFAETLNKSGHEASIREQEESSTSAGGITSAAIALRVLPKPFAQKGPEGNRSFLEIAFSANRSERKIVVAQTSAVVGSAGSIGKRGEYDVAALTPDVIGEHVLKALREAFATSRG